MLQNVLMYKKSGNHNGNKVNKAEKLPRKKETCIMNLVLEQKKVDEISRT